jgi:transcriptional regulator with GAF, ATPase, and Fis domain
MGHAAGTKEAQVAMKVRIDRPQIDAFLVGPQLHALRGEVYVEPVTIEANVKTGEYFSELTWHHSAEAEAHTATFGGSSEPVCWMQIGYASGYTSAIMERAILFREVECIACGSPQCRIVGKPVEEWPDDYASQFMPRRSFIAKRLGPSIGPKAAEALVSSDVVGTSPGFLGAWHLLRRVAPLDTTVLLLGETGVGKEIFARALHSASSRSKKPLYCVNCAAFPETLIDAELFGVERGAYTGAFQSREGWFEAADGSALFLDEIGTLSLTTQAKLLRVLQEGQLSRIGGTKTKQVNVRVVCATNLNLDAEVVKGTFRADLLHRLNIVPIKPPPLRDRRDDIPLLISHFLQRFNEKVGRAVSGFTAEAIEALFVYEFPGNIRELENMVERAAILTPDGEPISLFHLFSHSQLSHRPIFKPQSTGKLGSRSYADEHIAGDDQRGLSIPDNLSLKQIEQLAIDKALDACQGNISKASRTLGISRSRLRYYIQRQQRR